MLVKSIGGTPLVNHLVCILDEKGRRVGNPVTTDGEGILRAEVPANEKYRVEILDEGMEHAVAPLHTGDERAVLLCQFMELDGSPVANEKVEVKAGEDKFELTTDERGRLESPARLGACELTVRNESFIAHALAVADKEREESVYRFVLGEAGPADVHVLAAEMKSIGNTPLVRHPVRILDPETGAEVAYAVTDAEGVVRVEVPENKAYRIEIVDEAEEHVAPPLHPDDAAAVLLCQFLDTAGNPIANEKLEASAAGESFELQTDGNGRIESPARLDAYELRIRGVAFTAHALLARDRDREGSLYRFIVPAQGGEPET
jgi:hypothetical protein